MHCCMFNFNGGGSFFFNQFWIDKTFMTSSSNKIKAFQLKELFHLGFYF